MIIWGGGGGNEDVNTGARYAPASDSWTAMTTAGAPSPRSLPTAVWTGSEMIVWGGAGPPTGALNSGGRYSPASDTWRPTSQGSGVPDRRTRHTAVWTGNEMIVWGGYVNNGLRFEHRRPLRPCRRFLGSDVARGTAPTLAPSIRPSGPEPR